jgi:hypothetical protein
MEVRARIRRLDRENMHYQELSSRFRDPLLRLDQSPHAFSDDAFSLGDIDRVQLQTRGSDVGHIANLAHQINGAPPGSDLARAPEDPECMAGVHSSASTSWGPSKMNTMRQGRSPTGA